MAFAVCNDSLYLPEYGVQVFRLKEGTQAHVRLLAPTYGGLTQHYDRRSGGIYCRDERCPVGTHKIPEQYRGYCAAQVYNQQRRLWVHTVLEMTEKCEMDMRPHFRRGQVWLVSKSLKMKKKMPKMRAELLEQLDADQLPPAFEILGVLRTFYHCQDLMLNKLNPMPLPVFFDGSADSPPKGLTTGMPGAIIEAAVPEGGFAAAYRARSARNGEHP